MWHGILSEMPKELSPEHKVHTFPNGRMVVLMKDEDPDAPGEIRMREYTHPDFWHMTVLEAEWWGNNVLAERCVCGKRRLGQCGNGGKMCLKEVV